MTANKISGLLVSVVIVVAIGLGGLWLLRRTEPGMCPICYRHIHHEAQVVMKMEGRDQRVCCVNCARTVGWQAGRRVSLIEVYDFATGRPLQPESAYYVEGSEVIFCEVAGPLVGQSKQPYERTFDRCEPSVFAFARLEDAREFVTQHGGQLMGIEQVMREGAGSHDQPHH
jgi:hypothetical protein